MHKIESKNIKPFKSKALYTKKELSKLTGNPKISVIIPVYQEEKILEQTLRFYNQDLREKFDFELIVSDGGSTDRTVEIAKNYADKVVVHSEDRRQTIAEGRNKGAEVAVADALVFINADTFPADIESFFERIVEWNSSEAKYGALACYVSAFPEEEILKDRIFYTLHNSYVSFLNKLGLGMGRGECQIVRKDVFHESGCYNSLIVAGEDFDLYRRIARISKIKFDRKIHVLESPRRFRKYGYFKTLYYWLINSITVILFNKSVSKEWEAIR